MNRSYNIGVTLLLLCLLTACGTSRRVAAPGGAVHTGVTASDLRDTILAHRERWVAVQATLQGELSTKDKSFSARIHLQAAKGQGIRISVVPFPLIEAARVWFTPTEVTFVDLVHGRYARESYVTFSERLGVTIDYPQIEALFMGSVFAPGIGSDLKALRQLQYVALPEGKHGLSGKLRDMLYRFTLDPSARLEHLAIEHSSREPLLDVVYASSGGSVLPMLSAPAVEVFTLYPRSTDQEGSKSELRLEWRKVTLLDDANALQLTPVIKDKYERIDLEYILKRLDGNE